MIVRVIHKILLILIIVLIVGCTSIVLPYKEDSLCARRNIEMGYCGSVSDVYEKVNEIKKQEKEERRQER